MIASKNVSIQCNSFVETRYKHIVKVLTESISDIAALNKTGYCGGTAYFYFVLFYLSHTEIISLYLKIRQNKKLKAEVPRNFYLTVCFIESLALVQGLPSKQEYQS